MNGKGKIWLLDDSASFLEVASNMIDNAGFEVLTYINPLFLIDDLSARRPDVIISDVVMPEMDGVALLEAVSNVDTELPVILVTSYPQYDLVLRAIKGRAFDFLEKPFNKDRLEHAIYRATVYRRSVIERRECHVGLEKAVIERTKQLQNSLDEVKLANIETIHALTKAVESRHRETGKHIVRIGWYSYYLAKDMGLDEEYCDMILHASPMHDIGKIGISDRILLKEELLSEEEYKEMKRHTVIGYGILDGAGSNMLKMAKHIAFCHHEKWDGGGYPEGRKGAMIPLSARIVILADQYDALRSRRPYKTGVSHKDALYVLKEGDERTLPTHFDPRVMKSFNRIHHVFERVFERVFEM
jgi:putative two-component system response regulator